VKYTLTNVVNKYILPKNPDAALWLMGFFVYCHAIDDIIDHDIPESKTRQQLIVENSIYAEAVFSNIFYIRNVNVLRPLVRQAAFAYRDSIAWFDSAEVWKRQIADHLRSLGNEVTLAVVDLVCGQAVRNEISLNLRETAYWEHHDKDGNPT
jgi:hypothetical protein